LPPAEKEEGRNWKPACMGPRRRSGDRSSG
jgi:hypothetical protein